jgi:hypothetical protein
MKVFEAILLAILSSGLIVIFAMGYQNSIVIYFRKRFQRYRAKKCIKKLEAAGYFNLTPRGKINSSKKGLVNACQSCYGFKQIWDCLDEMDFDYRSFVLYFNRDDSSIDIDVIQLNKTLALLGLDIMIFESENKGEFNQDVLLNGATHLIRGDMTDQGFDRNVLYRFSEIVNEELEKVGSEERTYIIGDTPTKLVFLTDKLHQLIL